MTQRKYPSLRKRVFSSQKERTDMVRNILQKKRNKKIERYMFFMMRPTAGETTVAYGTQLREKESECDFGDSCEDRILEHLIQI